MGYDRPVKPLDLDRQLAREREDELARINRRRADRDSMRRVHRRRRAILVAVLAVPIALIGLATAWPGGKDPAVEPAQSSAPASVESTAATSTSIAPEHVSMPAEVRGAQVSMFAAGKPDVWGSILAKTNKKSGLNAVVLDVRNEEGFVAFTKGMPDIARASGAAADYYNVKKTVTQAHDAGLYVIGRVVAFQDPIIATKYPRLAIKSKTSGKIWKNANGKGWLNPYNKDAQDYAIAVASAAAAQGFDEIQFDYARFPTDGNLSNLVFKPKSTSSRSDVIAGFLGRARETLAPFGVKVSADLFGIAANQNQGNSLGQVPEQIGCAIDVISPMAYPSHYGAGTYGIPVPSESPGDLIEATLAEWRIRTLECKPQLRPWLQDFGGYGPAEVQAQIRAARRIGAKGFMIWNAASEYSSERIIPAG